jgi:hypothetical protein
MRTGSLRLFAPLTLTGAWSPLIQGLPPLYVALSGFDYPLSGFLLQVLGIHLSGPSVLGVFPFRAFFPLPSRTPSQGLCSLDLFPFASGHDRERAWPSEPLSRQRACLALPAITQTTESLLSWGSPSLRLHSFDPADRRRLLFCTLGPCRRHQHGALEFFCQKRGLISKRNQPTPLMFSPPQSSKPFVTIGNAGLWFHRTKLVCITTLSPSFLALPKRAC